MLFLLLLSSCGLFAEPKVTPAVAEQRPNEAGTASFINAWFPKAPDRVTLPPGHAVVRECYASHERDRTSGRGNPGAAPGGVGGSGSQKRARPSSGASAAATGAMPPPAPSTLAPGGIPESAPAQSAQATSGKDAVATAADDAKAAPATERRLSSDENAGVLGSLKQEAPEAEAAQSRMDRQSPERDKAKGGDEMTVRKTAEPQAPDMDWGATVYLSNDDSMSLASAQRLLYAVQNNVRFQASQIRPHELLNYFSFDTEPVRDGQMFSVLASAEQTAPGTFTLAMAVRGAMPPRLPLDLTLVVDRSGSMSDEGRLDYVKRALHLVDTGLRDGDRVDMVIFDNEVCTPLEGFVVGRDERALFRTAIDDLRPRASTNLDLGLQTGYQLAVAHANESFKGSDDRNHRVMLLTDALLNTGSVDVNVVSEIGKAYDSHGIRLTGVGVGREFNDAMLDKLTEKGKGAYVYLGSEAVVDRLFGVGFESLTRTIAHDVRFALDLPDSLAMKRFYGEEASTNPEEVQPINYYAGTSQVFLQDLAVRPGRLDHDDPLTLTISYKDAVSGKLSEQEFRSTIGALLSGDQHNLHKARALMSWTDVLIARTMNADPCGPALQEFQNRIHDLGDDAEITFVEGLVAARCEQEPVVPKVVSRGVSYKVRLDSDIPIAEVALHCAGETERKTISSGNVAVFETRPGPCQLTLFGATEMHATVEVPSTGGTLKCLVRGGRVNCS
jgi:Ca-activated chloride channel homolog